MLCHFCGCNHNKSPKLLTAVIDTFMTSTHTVWTVTAEKFLKQVEVTRVRHEDRNRLMSDTDMHTHG